jgi:hypothetical protein
MEGNEETACAACAACVACALTWERVELCREVFAPEMIEQLRVDNLQTPI